MLLPRRWYGRVLLAVGTPVLLLLLVELMLRWRQDPRATFVEQLFPARLPVYSLGRLGLLRCDPDPRLCYTLQPGFRGVAGGFEHRINELGLRGSPLEAKRSGCERIAGVGDSYAFGFGVSEEDGVCGRLWFYLKQSARNVEVLNCGVPGYHTGQEAAFLERVLLTTQLDTVVHLYYGDDQVEAHRPNDPHFHLLYQDGLPFPHSSKRWWSQFAIYGFLVAADHRRREGLGQPGTSPIVRPRGRAACRTAQSRRGIPIPRSHGHSLERSRQ